MFANCSSISSTILLALCLVINAAWSAQTSSRLNVYQINAKKQIHIVNDKFLSFTVDPTSVIHVADCQSANATISLVRTLLPAYLRVAGPESNRLLFKSKTHNSKLPDSASIPSGVQRNKHHMLLTANQWSQFNEFVSKSGLSLIVCLNGAVFNENTDDRDLSNGLEFITYSNKNNFSMDWQLGYELQQISNDDGHIPGQEVTKLRKILEIFPRYQHSLIIGPDATSVETREDLRFLRNYLTEAQNSLNAFTVHPNFPTGNESNDDDVYTMLSEHMSKMDNYLWSKDGSLRTMSKGVVPKKPVWIAESDTKDSICNFFDTMVFVKRLGAAARAGASVYLRKPHLMSFYEPTSEYWVAALHKSLVGRIVLDSKFSIGNATAVQLFSHCTRIFDQPPPESVLNPAVRYERGAITVYGVNTGSEPIRLAFKVGVRSHETMHLYVLTEESKTPASPNIMLNKQSLRLSADNEIPLLSPKIRQSTKYALVPPKSIFFVVLPDAKSRACLSPAADQPQDKIKFKLPSYTDINDGTVDSDDATGSDNNDDEYAENDDEDNQKARYVTYPKRKSNSMLASAPSLGVRYVSFTDDTWMSELPQKLKEAFDKERHQPKEVDHGKKVNEYQLLASAVLGKRMSNATDGSPRSNARQRRSIDVETAELLYRSLDNIDDLEPYVYHHARVSSRPSPINQAPREIRKRRHISESLTLNASSGTLDAKSVLAVDPINETDAFLDSDDDSVMARANRDIHHRHKTNKNTFSDLSELEENKRHTSSSSAKPFAGPVSPFPKRTAKKTQHTKPKKAEPESALANPLPRANDMVEPNGTISTGGETLLSLSNNETTTNTVVNQTSSSASKPMVDQGEKTATNSTTPTTGTSSKYVSNSTQIVKNASSSAAKPSPPGNSTKSSLSANSTESIVTVKSTSALPLRRKFDKNQVSSVRRRVLADADVSMARSRRPADEIAPKRTSRPSTPTPSPTRRSTPPRLAPSEILEFYNGKLKEILNKQAARAEELRQRARNRAVAARQRNASLRNKRQISYNSTMNIKFGPDGEPDIDITEDVVTLSPNGKRGIVGVARSRPHSSTASPANNRFDHHSAKTTTSAASEPSSKRFKQSKLHGNIRNRTTTPRPREKFDRRDHRRVERDLLGTAFTRAKELCSNISVGVQNQIKPITNWFANCFDDVKHYVYRRDAQPDDNDVVVTNHRIEVRDVGDHHQSKLSDKLGKRGEEHKRDGNSFRSRFNLLRNRTAKHGNRNRPSESTEKPSKIHHNRATRSIDNNEVFDEPVDNEILDNTGKKFDLMNQNELKNNILVSTEGPTISDENDDEMADNYERPMIETLKKFNDDVNQQQSECSNHNFLEYGWCKIKLFVKWLMSACGM